LMFLFLSSPFFERGGLVVVLEFRTLNKQQPKMATMWE